MTLTASTIISWVFRFPGRKRVLALSEFGGYSLRIPEHSACKNTYGYKKFATSDGLTSGFARLMEDTIVPSVKKGYSAAIYSSSLDIEEEVNGLITYDRKKVKMNPLIVQKWNARIQESAEAIYVCKSQTTSRNDFSTASERV